jgi:erythromycin esterase
MTWRISVAKSGLTLLLLLLLLACQSQAPLHSAKDGKQSCNHMMTVRGVVAAHRAQGAVRYHGATVSIIRAGGNEASAIVSSDSLGRFEACVPPGRYAITATAPDGRAFYQAPQVIAAERQQYITLEAGGIELRGTVAYERPIPPGTYVRLTRISSDVGDIFFAPVRADGVFVIRVFPDYNYKIDLSGNLVSLPVAIESRSSAQIKLSAFDRKIVESPPVPAVVRWMRDAAIPLHIDKPIAHTGDWQALQSIIGGAKVIGLGENTHGAATFAEIRNRLVESAVTHLGFRAFAIEANFTEALAINDYVLLGRGDPKKALAGLHFWVSDNEEALHLIEWMRQYNEDPRHKQKVKFYGVDMQYSQVAYEELMRFLEPIDRQAAEKTRVRLGVLRSEDRAEFYKLSPEEQARVCDATIAQVESLDRKRPDYVEVTGKRRWVIARQNAVILQQACALSMERVNSNDLRDRLMAENVRWILETEGPDTRVLLWAHNAHVSTSLSSRRPMGYHLRAALGKDYIAVGQLFGHGRFRAWDMREEEEERRSVVPVSIPPAPAGYLEAGMARVGLPMWAIDLRRLPPNGEVRRWFSTPHPSREIGALYFDETSSRTLLPVTDHFDALIFVDEIEPTKPNPSGLRGPSSH